MNLKIKSKDHKGQNNAHLFIKGVLGNKDKKVARYLVFQIAQGRWDLIVKLAKDLGYPTPLKEEDIKVVIDPNGKNTDAVIFRNRLMVDKELRSQMKAIPKGDFSAVVALASKEGLHITKNSFKTSHPSRVIR